MCVDLFVHLSNLSCIKHTHSHALYTDDYSAREVIQVKTLKETQRLETEPDIRWTELETLQQWTFVWVKVITPLITTRFSCLRQYVWSLIYGCTWGPEISSLTTLGETHTKGCISQAKKWQYTQFDAYFLNWHRASMRVEWSRLNGYFQSKYNRSADH